MRRYPHIKDFLLGVNTGRESELSNFGQRHQSRTARAVSRCQRHASSSSMTPIFKALSCLICCCC